MDRALAPVVTIGTALIGVAIVAVILSKRSATVDVLGAMWGGFNTALKTAVSPISS